MTAALSVHDPDEGFRLLPRSETLRLLEWWLTAPKDARGEPLWCSHRIFGRCRFCALARH